jgi:hypothetical protein
MKYNRILSISIPVGILLSGCGMTGKVTPPPTSVPLGSAISSDGKNALTNATGTNHTQPFPNYVKHNPHTLSKLRYAKGTTATKYGNIYAELFKPYHDNRYYIRYMITDMDGYPGAWHWKDSGNNESSKSTLFTTTFDHRNGKDIDVERDGNEVTISGTGTDGQCYKWISDATDSTTYPKDSDVKWKSVKCQ